MKQTVSKQVIQKEQKRNRREGQGRSLAISRHVYQVSTKTFYVESQTTDNRYYFVRYQHDEFEWCSCKDYESNRSERCKHIFAVIHGLEYNTIKKVEHLPKEVQIKRESKTAVVAQKYENESIRTLNDLGKAEIEAEPYRTQRLLSYEDDEYSF